MDMAHLVVALAPAFAAGFALQRLLEILDPIFDKLNDAQLKKIILGLISFAAGLGLAAWPKVRVLKELVAPDSAPSLLDYFVTALIVSGGTEGFNSILKFLNYKKEETKGAAQTKAVDAATATAAFQRRMNMRVGNTTLPLTANGLASSGDLADDLATAFHDEIEQRFPDQFIEDGWDERPFSEFVDDLTLFKMQDAATEAADTVATAIDVQLTDEARLRIQARVTLKSTPKKVLPTMENEVASA